MKRLLSITVTLALAFTAYVLFVNRNTPDMTPRQKILRAVYPALTTVTRLLGSKSMMLHAPETIEPYHSIYDLSVTLNNGGTLPLSTLKGKKILFVNTASDCGYTAQYEDLQALHERLPGLTIIGFPANDFKEQEKRSDEDIAAFCKINYGVTFPLARKSSVVKGKEQVDVFRWLSDHHQNGWNDQAPTWNFSKYLVNEQGHLTHYMDPSITPSSPEFRKAIP
jgi:glutathione peroxidase